MRQSCNHAEPESDGYCACGAHQFRSAFYAETHEGAAVVVFAHTEQEVRDEDHDFVIVRTATADEITTHYQLTAGPWSVDEEMGRI